MSLQEQNMTLMVKGRKSYHFVPAAFSDLLPRGSSLASEDGSWVQLMAALRVLSLLTMLRLVVD